MPPPPKRAESWSIAGESLVRLIRGRLDAIDRDGSTRSYFEYSKRKVTDQKGVDVDAAGNRMASRIDEIGDNSLLIRNVA